ncbi:MAG: ABC transporter substrate-binding protein [Chloroflexota bacterium]
MDRRRFLKAFGAGAGLVAVLPLVEACSPSAPATKPADAPAAKSDGAPKPAEAAKPADAAKPAEAAKPAAAAPAKPAGAPKRGGTLTIMVQNDWVTLDPVYNSAEPNGNNMLYGEWIRWQRGADGKWGPAPEMVAEWDQKPEALTLKLQKGIKFHDGTPWDAKAAKWNMDRLIFDPAAGVRAYLRGVDQSKENKDDLEKLKETAAKAFNYSSKAVEVVNDETIKVNLAKPIAGFVTLLTNAMQNQNPISPEAFLKAGKDAFGRNPVGAGPYRFVEWKSGSHVILERNPDYWKKGADGQALPYIDKLQYRLIIDDSARLLELKSGAAQFMELVQGKDLAGVKAESSLQVMETEFSGNNYRMIFDSANADSPFSKHLKLRQAFLYSLDREAMAKTLGFGSGIGRKYLSPKGSFAYDETEKIPFYWFDKAKAEALVKEVIAQDASVASGGKINVTLSVIDRAVDKAQSEMIKQMAEGVGFNVTLETMERAAWTAKLVRRPGQPGGKFDVATMRNPVTIDDPDGQWRNYYHSNGGFNVAHIESKDWDGIVEKASELYDQAERKKLYAQMDQMAFDQGWYGFLWQQNWNWAYSKKLQNFQEPVTNRWLFSECWLEG